MKSTKVKKSYIIFIAILTLLIIGYCNLPEPKVFYESDYRIFKGTEAWDLAKAVESEDIEEIKKYKGSKLINARDTLYDISILNFAVLSGKYESTKALLEIGADPNILSIMPEKNKPFPFIKDTIYALREAVFRYKKENKFVPLLLKYGATKNINCDLSDSTHPQTAMITAAAFGNMNAIKEMEKYGGNVFINCPKHGNMYRNALIQNQIFVINYLILEKKVEIYSFKYKYPKREEQNNLLHYLREMKFKLDSEEYKAKMQLVKYLLENFGLDYWKEPIPKDILYRFKEDQEYLNKY